MSSGCGIAGGAVSSSGTGNSISGAASIGGVSCAAWVTGAGGATGIGARSIMMAADGGTGGTMLCQLIRAAATAPACSATIAIAAPVHWPKP